MSASRELEPHPSFAGLGFPQTIAGPVFVPALTLFVRAHVPWDPCDSAGRPVANGGITLG